MGVQASDTPRKDTKRERDVQQTKGIKSFFQAVPSNSLKKDYDAVD
jgi:hypothetical protein